MSNTSRLTSKDPGVRLSYLNELASCPEDALANIEHTISLLDDPLAGCDDLGTMAAVVGKSVSKGKAGRLLRKACRQVLEIVAAGQCR